MMPAQALGSPESDPQRYKEVSLTLAFVAPCSQSKLRDSATARVIGQLVGAAGFALGIRNVNFST
jgi:hypothetical protein